MADWEQYECPDCGRRWGTGLGEYPMFSWRNAKGECWHEEPVFIADKPRPVRARMVSNNG